MPYESGRFSRIALVEEDSHWSQLCLDALKQGGYSAILLPRRIDALLPDDIPKQFHLVPVRDSKNQDFELIDHIYRFKGKALVLAGTRSHDICAKAFLKYHSLCLQKSANFNELIDLIEVARYL